jgi:hypothetical protein
MDVTLMHNRLQFMATWIIGAPLGYYLTFYARPTFGLDGLWYGILTGNGLLSISFLLKLIFLDWTNECRKFNYRLRKQQQILEGRPSVGAYLVDISFPNVANISIGGFQIRTATLEEDMEELEMTEESLANSSNPLMSDFETIEEKEDDVDFVD